MVCPCALGTRGGYRGRYHGGYRGRYHGGYRATSKNRQLLKKYKRGQSIGFTARASLKAKGLLPRSNGRYVLGPKYSGTKRLTRRYRHRGGRMDENNIDVRRANYRNWWQQWKAAVLRVGRGEINALPPEVGGARPVNPDFPDGGVGGLPPPPLPVLIHGHDQAVFNEGLRRLGLSVNHPYLPL